MRESPALPVCILILRHWWCASPARLARNGRQAARPAMPGGAARGARRLDGVKKVLTTRRSE